MGVKVTARVPRCLVRILEDQGTVTILFGTAFDVVAAKDRSMNNCRGYARQSVEFRRLATAATFQIRQLFPERSLVASYPDLSQ